MDGCSRDSWWCFCEYRLFPEDDTTEHQGKFPRRMFDSLSYMATMIQVDFRFSEMGWNHQPVSQKQLDPQHCLSPDPWHDPVARMALPESTGWIWLMSSTISMTGPYKVNLCPISGMHISPCKVLTCSLSLRLSRCGQGLRHVKTQI